MSQHQASENVAEADVEPKVVHTDKLARLKYEANKRRMIDAYNNRASSGDSFLNAVREFANIKLRYLEYEFGKTGTYTTADDYAQDVVIAVWERLPEFKGGTGEAFYAWVHRIAFLKAAKFFKVLLNKKQNYTTLTVTGKDEDGDDEEIDNPELFSEGGYSDGRVHIPDWTTTLERCIFGLMKKEVFDPERPNYVTPGSRVLNPYNPKGGYRGMNYKEIAHTLSISKAPPGEDWSKITEGAVEARVRRVRKRVEREHEARKARVKAEVTIETTPQRTWEPKITREMTENSPVTVYYANGQKLSHAKRLSANAAETQEATA